VEKIDEVLAHALAAKLPVAVPANPTASTAPEIPLPPAGTGTPVYPGL
jgi:hypothetical protein